MIGLLGINLISILSVFSLWKTLISRRIWIYPGIGFIRRADSPANYWLYIAWHSVITAALALLALFVDAKLVANLISGLL